MKMNFGKRLVLFLHWLISLFVCALVACNMIRPSLLEEFVSMLNGMFGTLVTEIAGIVLIALYALLAVMSIVFIFSREKGKKRSERGFITVDSSEAGRTRIAVGAVEQMIRQSVRCVDGIADMKSSIVNGDDSISINASVAIVSGAHVPTVTMNIQRAIRSYIELNCGVAVREVSVSVHSLTGDDDGKSSRRKNIPAAPAAPVIPSVPLEEAKVSEIVVPAETIVETPSAAEEEISAGEAVPAEETAAEET